jgi:uncharacterized membrane protein YbhN (UPF0104 family)
MRELARPLALSAVAVVLSGVRWQMLLAAMGFTPPLRRCLYAVLATWPVATLTPSRSGDLLRAMLLRREVPLVEGMASVVAEKWIDLQSLAAMVALGAAWSGRPAWGLAALGGLTCLVSAWWALPLLGAKVLAWGRPGWLCRRLPGLLAVVPRSSSARLRLAGVSLLSLAAWALSIWIISDLLIAAGYHVALRHLLLAWPLSVVAAALPLTVTGFGARDGALLLLLGTLAGDAAGSRGAILAATLVYPLITSWLYAFAGLPFTAHAAHHGAAGSLFGAARDEELIDEGPAEQSQSADPPVDAEGERG